MVGLSIYVFAAVVAIFATSFPMLLGLRFLQGSGAAASVVIAVAMVRDRFKGEEMAQIMSFSFMVLLIVPVIAPSIGQGIMLLGDWHLVFIFMAVMGTIVNIWTALRMPETLTAENRRPSPSRPSPRGSAMSSATGVDQLYSGDGADHRLPVRLSEFLAADLSANLWPWPLVPARLRGGCIGDGAWQLHQCEACPPPWPKAHVAWRAAAVFGGGIILLVMALSFAVPVWLFIIMIAAMFYCFAGIGPNFGSLALEPLGHVAGTAASTQGAIQTVAGALIGATLGQSFNGTIVPLAAGFVVLSGLALVMVLVAEKGRLTLSKGSAGSDR